MQRSDRRHAYTAHALLGVALLVGAYVWRHRHALVVWPRPHETPATREPTAPPAPAAYSADPFANFHAFTEGGPFLTDAWDLPFEPAPDATDLWRSLLAPESWADACSACGASIGAASYEYCAGCAAAWRRFSPDGSGDRAAFERQRRTIGTPDA